jgi:hypothetical protein
LTSKGTSIQEIYTLGSVLKTIFLLNILKMGEWNTIEIRVKGGQITTWLNGEQMVDINDDKIAKGKGAIALQIHSGGGIKVRWKNLMVKEL